METILIPKVSTLTKDKEIFSNLSKFSAVTGYVPGSESASAFEINPLTPDSRVTRFLRNLRNCVLTKSKANYEIISNDKYTLFSTETLTELAERKKVLVQLVKKHEAVVLVLREARMNCWKSKDKIDKYKLKLETQRSALRYNQDEMKIRTAAIENMESMFDKWMAIHEKDHIEFEKRFLEEINYREKIHRVSKDIEADILEMLADAIQAMMDRNRQHINDTEISKLSQQLYIQTSRKYSFTSAKNIPCQKVWIEKPQYVTSILSDEDITKKVKHQVLTGLRKRIV